MNIIWAYMLLFMLNDLQDQIITKEMKLQVLDFIQYRKSDIRYRL